MGSDSRSPRARHRFGFSGPLTRQKKERVTTDDILDSLTRQAEIRQKLGEDDRVRLEEIAGTEELIPLQGFNPDPEFPSVGAKKRSLGHLAFVLMLLTGLTVVWLYSSISKPFDLASLTSIIQKSGHSVDLRQQGSIRNNCSGRLHRCSVDSAQKARIKHAASFQLNSQVHPGRNRS